MLMSHPDKEYSWLCLAHGHDLQPTGKPGQYHCARCGAIGYCPGCALVMPEHALELRCPLHEERPQQREENRL